MTKFGIEEQLMPQSTIDVRIGASKDRSLQAATAGPNFANAETPRCSCEMIAALVGSGGDRR